jgi:hypothetical protein
MNLHDHEAIRQSLEFMLADSTYHTPTSYSADSAQYPDNRMPFVETHMNYLRSHPLLEPSKYLANMKLRSRIR